MWLSCTADGFPRPKITWTRLPTNRIVSMPFTITGKHDEGVYRCTASNGIGNPATADVFISVHCKSQLWVLPPNEEDSSVNDPNSKYTCAL